MSPERQGRYLGNPLELFRGLASVALSTLRHIDDAIAELGDANETRPYSETNYPPIRQTEAPVAEEDMLWQQDY